MPISTFGRLRRRRSRPAPGIPPHHLPTDPPGIPPELGELAHRYVVAERGWSAAFRLYDMIQRAYVGPSRNFDEMAQQDMCGVGAAGAISVEIRPRLLALMAEHRIQAVRVYGGMVVADTNYDCHGQPWLAAGDKLVVVEDGRALDLNAPAPPPADAELLDLARRFAEARSDLDNNEFPVRHDALSRQFEDAYLTLKGRLQAEGLRWVLADDRLVYLDRESDDAIEELPATEGRDLRAPASTQGSPCPLDQPSAVLHLGPAAVDLRAVRHAGQAGGYLHGDDPHGSGRVGVQLVMGDVEVFSSDPAHVEAINRMLVALGREPVTFDPTEDADR